MSDESYQRILRFWLGASPEEAKAGASRWFRKDPAFDRQIRDEFGGDLLRAKSGELDAWQEQPESCLALVILLDQFSRNMYRDTPAAFAQDELALRASLMGIERGFDQRLSPIQRYFFYMPLMHAEDRAVQRQSLASFERLCTDTAGEAGEKDAMFGQAMSYAKRHQEIVERFGRFPHRNRILGRRATPEEEAFLLTPGSSF